MCERVTEDCPSDLPNASEHRADQHNYDQSGQQHLCQGSHTANRSPTSTSGTTSCDPTRYSHSEERRRQERRRPGPRWQVTLTRLSPPAAGGVANPPVLQFLRRRAERHSRYTPLVDVPPQPVVVTGEGKISIQCRLRQLRTRRFPAKRRKVAAWISVPIRS